MQKLSKERSILPQQFLRKLLYSFYCGVYSKFWILKKKSSHEIRSKYLPIPNLIKIDPSVLPVLRCTDNRPPLIQTLDFWNGYIISTKYPHI